MALVLEAGLRANRRAAERLLADSVLRRRSLAGWQQHVEALRMYGYPLAGVWGRALHVELRSAMIPKLEFVAVHACASFSTHVGAHLLQRVLLSRVCFFCCVVLWHAL